MLFQYVRACLPRDLELKSPLQLFETDNVHIFLVLVCRNGGHVCRSGPLQTALYQGAILSILIKIIVFVNHCIH
jgi:hypothetical protein